MFSKNEKDSLYEHDCKLDKIYCQIAEIRHFLENLNENVGAESPELINAMQSLHKAERNLSDAQRKLSQIY